MGAGVLLLAGGRPDKEGPCGQEALGFWPNRGACPVRRWRCACREVSKGAGLGRGAEGALLRAQLSSSMAPGLARFPRSRAACRKPSGGLVYPSPSFPGRKSLGRAVPRGPQACEDSQRPSPRGGVWGAGSVRTEPGRACRACGLECTMSCSSGVSSRLVHLVSRPLSPTCGPVWPQSTTSRSFHTCTTPLRPLPWVGCVRNRGGGGPGSWREEPLTQRKTLGASLGPGRRWRRGQGEGCRAVLAPCWGRGRQEMGGAPAGSLGCGW